MFKFLSKLFGQESLSIEEFEAHATLAVANLSDLMQSDETPDAETISSIKSILWRVGKMAGSLESKALSGYWQYHFLVATADVLVTFENAFEEAHGLYAGAADEMDDIEKEHVQEFEQVVGSIADVGAIQKYSAELSWLAAVALMNQDPNSFDYADDFNPEHLGVVEEFRGHLEDCVRKLSENRQCYSIDMHFNLALEIAPHLIVTSKTKEDWDLTIQGLNYAMNDLTSSMEMGSRPYDAVRAYPQAALLLDYFLLAIKQAGYIDRAAEIESEAAIDEVETPWREEDGSKFSKVKNYLDSRTG